MENPLSYAISGMLETFTAPAVVISPEYRILATNSAYRSHFGVTGEVNQAHCYRVSHRFSMPCDQAGETCPLKRCRETNMPQRDLHLHHTPNGEEHVEVEMFPVHDETGEISFFLEVMHSSHLVSSQPNAGGLVGRSASFTRALELVGRVAPSAATVLLLGESGTGKELVAKAVHDASERANGPFVPVDCSGLTETLFESELFGHEKGAFTGAQMQKIGLVEAARGGTLFLDEIGDVPLSLQVKLLRLLETGTFRRVGGIEPQKADFRLVCATHRSLKQMVEKGEFRNDLFYRINTFPVILPSLRERVEDLPLLCENLLLRVAPNRKLSMSPAALRCLQKYAFPGNIRELRNIIERAALLSDGDQILEEHLPAECGCGQSRAGMAPVPGEVVSLEEMERRYLNWVVARHQGDKRSLAKRLGVSERTLYRKLQELNETGDA